MKKLIKTIHGQECEVFAICHHNRIPMGKAVPKIEVYENSVEVPTIGASGIKYKNTCFSIVICPNPKMSEDMTEEMLSGLRFFDLSMMVPRKDDILVPFTVYGVTEADISEDCWEFPITDTETVKQLLSL